jgi:hypothetical protein
VTKVIGQFRISFLTAVVLFLATGVVPKSWGQAHAGDMPAASTPQSRPAETLYLQLRSVGLDKSRVYRIRDLSIDRAALHITFNDGTIAFTEDVLGRVTGAFFEGDGEALLMPPNQVERASMALFTGSAILEQKFFTAYFRFNDDTFGDLQPSLIPAENAADFVAKWNDAARNLAQVDALRLLITFSQFLPLEGAQNESASSMPTNNGTSSASKNQDRMLSVRLQSLKLGTFDLHYDSNSPEQIWAGQLKAQNGQSYYDVWASFPEKSAGRRRLSDEEPITDVASEAGRSDVIEVAQYTIEAHIHPPTELDAEATLQVEIKQEGQRALPFELSRFLKIKQVDADGHPVEFIQNQALEGTQVARRGNDIIAIVLPAPLKNGQRVKLRFLYGGEVLSQAGGGLLYVGARGLWYPNRGLAMSNFDLEFHYPSGWTLVATGKQGQARSTAGSTANEQVSRWISERSIPLAGFNLGRYSHVVAHAGGVKVTTYAAADVERDFPKPQVPIEQPELLRPPGTRTPEFRLAPIQPSPARNAQVIADHSAQAVQAFSRWFGAYPYDQLSLTQMPGVVSQSWPSLIYLSTFSFLTAEEKSQLKMDPVRSVLTDAVVAHETAHQWWGDSVTWGDYHDQWIMEALANYSALMLLESESPAKFRMAMEKYRDDLLQKNQTGKQVMDSGPITLGTRLSSSQFPDGYEAISYGRGTWLLHMLRSMMRDGEEKSALRVHRDGRLEVSDEPFFKGLRKLREQYQGKSVSVRELFQAFEEQLPRSLWFNGRDSLDWFYQGWVNGTAVPSLEVANVKYVPKGGMNLVSGTILQKSAPDDLVTSVPIYALVAGKNVFLGRVFADGPETQFHFAAPAGAHRVVVDPNHTVLTRAR